MFRFIKQVFIVLSFSGPLANMVNAFNFKTCILYP